MDLAHIETALLSRLTGDTGSGGLRNALSPLVAGVWVSNAPSAQAMPLCIIDLASQREANAFSKDIFEVEAWVSTMVARTGTTPLQTASDILARVYGDSSAGAAPSYGLHRHPLSLSGSWTATPIGCMGVFAEHDDNAYVYRQVFKFHVSK